MPQAYWLVELHCYAKSDLYYRLGSPFDWTDSERHATRFWSKTEADQQAVKFAKYQNQNHRIEVVQYPKPTTMIPTTWSI